jgi:hypothetical protein
VDELGLESVTSVCLLLLVSPRKKNPRNFGKVRIFRKCVSGTLSAEHVAGILPESRTSVASSCEAVSRVCQRM